MGYDYRDAAKGLAVIVLIVIMTIAFTKDAKAKGGSKYAPIPIQVDNIFRNLTLTAGLSRDKVRLSIVRMGNKISIGAMFNSTRVHIFMSTMALQLIRMKPDHIAFTLGHEIGHFILERHKRPPKSPAESKLREKAADMFSKRLMKRAGYNECKAADFFKYRIKLLGDRDGGANDAHPRYSTRYNYLRCKG